MEDPRDGLTLFGPLDESKPYGIKAGVIATAVGIQCFERWVEWVQRPVFNTTPLLGRQNACGRRALGSNLARRAPWITARNLAEKPMEAMDTGSVWQEHKWTLPWNHLNSPLPAKLDRLAADCPLHSRAVHPNQRYARLGTVAYHSIGDFW